MESGRLRQFISEVQFQCRLALFAFQRLEEQARLLPDVGKVNFKLYELRGSLDQAVYHTMLLRPDASFDAGLGVFLYLSSYLVHSTNVVYLLWSEEREGKPRTKVAADRSRELRRELHLQDEPTITCRQCRNAVIHFDDRLDTHVPTLDYLWWPDLLIRPDSFFEVHDLRRKDVLRSLDPITMTFFVNAGGKAPEEVNLRDLAGELNHIYVVADEWEQYGYAGY